MIVAVVVVVAVAVVVVVVVVVFKKALPLIVFITDTNCASSSGTP